ncbi:MAG: imidazolonepropionase [Halobacteriovoraceae bacterium]|nr:imidazolonepropionase [Halobacteriovoraceae bacterium]
MELTHYKNISQLITLESAHAKDGRNILPEDLSKIEEASIVFNEDEILWVGPTLKLPSDYADAMTIDLHGKTVLPEIVDSHTHLVFGGDRSFEYSMRLNGADYQAIADAGGGILSTMEKTITASEEELFESGVKRVNAIKSYGIKTIEMKSGYGLTFESERKICKVIQRLKEHFKNEVQIFCTFLAAHAVPKNFSSSSEFIHKVVLPLMHELAEDKLIDFVDIFHEQGYFSLKDSQELFEAATALHLKCKIHADEFNDNKGAVLATEFNALSADHLLCTTQDGIEALAKSDTVATLLPGTAFFLGKPLADAQSFLQAGCKVALASDYNPGSCHCDNLILIASIAAKQMGFNLGQLWTALCLNSAHALDLKNQGTIQKGFKPRFSIFDCESVDKITYHWGKNLAIEV